VIFHQLNGRAPVNVITALATLRIAAPMNAITLIAAKASMVTKSSHQCLKVHKRIGFLYYTWLYILVAMMNLTILEALVVGSLTKKKRIESERGYAALNSRRGTWNYHSYFCYSHPDWNGQGCWKGRCCLCASGCAFYSHWGCGNLSKSRELALQNEFIAFDAYALACAFS
jgi:hypothetical protein